MAFGYNERSHICFITHKMNVENFVELLHNVLIDFAETYSGDNFLFQQDNAPIHMVKKPKSFLKR